MRTAILGLAAVALLANGAAHAAVVFSDNFDGYGSTTILNAADTVFGGNWVTTDGTVDYIAPAGSFSSLCRGTGGCVDLDGSSANAGIFSTVTSFAPGAYTLAMTLFGSGRGSTESVTITLGNWSVTLPSIGSGDDASASFLVSTTGGVLSFSNTGGDNVGALLSSVELSTDGPSPVPEPGTLILLGLGLLGLGFVLRRSIK